MSTLAEPVDDVLPTVERLLADACAFETHDHAAADGWCGPAWQALAALGFPWLSVPTEAGGSGGTLTEAMAVLRGIGRHAAPVPVAETAVLGGWLAAAAGMRVGRGPLGVVADGNALEIVRGRVEGRATVAWGRRAERILALVWSPYGWLVVSAEPSQVELVPGVSLAGEPRDDVRFSCPLDELDHAPAADAVDAASLRFRGALTRVVQAAGALEAMAELTVDHTRDCHRSGRPMAVLRAMQDHLVTATHAAARVAMAADVAVRATERGGGRFEVAAARVVLDDAVAEVTRSSHQAHGAMGAALEDRLHHFSQRLSAWCHEYGNGRWWRQYLGAEIHAAGADEFFAFVTR